MAEVVAQLGGKANVEKMQSRPEQSEFDSYFEFCLALTKIEQYDPSRGPFSNLLHNVILQSFGVKKSSLHLDAKQIRDIVDCIRYPTAMTIRIRRI